jgi:phosphoribosylaminoimidazole carboxylase (NCAIR synthetase)
MAEEENDGSWSGLVKTIVGTVGTIVTAGGAWLGSQLFGGEEKAEQPAAQVAAPAPVINITNANQNAAPAAGKTVIIKEKEASPAPAPKKKTEKEALQEEPKW